MIDNIFMFSDAQTLAGSKHLSSNVADITGGTQGKDPFGNAINIPTAAGKLFLNVLITTVVAAGTCEVDLYSGSSATITSSMVHVCGLTIPSGAAAGSVFSVGVPPSDVAWDRYLGVIIDKASNAVTGNVDIWLGANPVTTHQLPR